MTLSTLSRLGYDISGLRSKSWDEFSGKDSPRIDLVLTVCGNAAGETCPVWSGEPVVGHWGVEDPVGFVGSPAAQAAFFERIHDELLVRIEALVAIDPSMLSCDELAARIREIGEG
jgi:arsenate reductase